MKTIFEKSTGVCGVELGDDYSDVCALENVLDHESRF